MAREILVRVETAGHSSVHHFDALPLRFGRDPANDLVLPFPWVSRRHGRLEWTDDQQVAVVDEGSVNRIVVCRAQTPTHRQVVLGVAGGTFSIDRLEVTVIVPGGPAEQALDLAPREPFATVSAANECEPEPAQPEVAAPRGTSHGSAIASALAEIEAVPSSERANDDENRTSLYEVERIQPRRLDAACALEEFRAARAQFLVAIQQAFADDDNGRRSLLAQEVALACSDLMHDPGIRKLATIYRDNPDGGPEAASTSARSDAADLASRIFPNEAPPTSETEADEFKVALHELVRAGVAYLSQYETPDSLTWRSLASSPGQAARLFESASRAQNEGLSEARAMAVCVLDELAPTHAELEASTRWWIAPFRSRARWRAYVARYSRIASARLLVLWKEHCAAAGATDGSTGLLPPALAPSLASNAALSVARWYRDGPSGDANS